MNAKQMEQLFWALIRNAVWEHRHDLQSWMDERFPEAIFNESERDPTDAEWRRWNRASSVVHAKILKQMGRRDPE